MCPERLTAARKMQLKELRAVRDLRRGVAEHPRSHGTAGAQLVKFVVCRNA